MFVNCNLTTFGFSVFIGLIMVIIIKQCSACGEYKELDNFYKAKRKLFNRSPICISCDKQRKSINRKKNREHYLEYSKKYRENNKDKIKQYELANKDRINENRRKNKAKRRGSDPKFVISHSLRCRLRSALAGESKSTSTLSLLGCSVEYLVQHLENQFTDGMNWDNYGLYGWHIDHIKPCASFDLTKEEEQRKCFHYTNLQPLWAKDNYAKGDKIL